MPGAHERALEALKRRGRLRTLEARSGLDFASNDYLGLATSGVLTEAAQAALVRGVAVGAGGSRLLRGNDPEHEALESDAAEHFRAESALFFGGGFQANYAIFSTLPARGDLVVHDGLIHASVLDGIRAGKADHVSAPHNDAAAIEAAISSWRAAGGTGKPWIAVESLYSMDGDTAPLSDLATIADRHDAMLVIDEAHATGVLGPDGRGLAAHLEGRDNVVSLHTCGKALGASGALVLSTRTMRDFLVNRCRPFIYATAPSPLMAAVVRESLRICRDEPQRRADLAKRVTAFGYGGGGASSHIVPVVVGGDSRATTLAAALKARGFDVRAIRPPTVPEGTARLRIAITLNVSEADAAALSAALQDELGRLAA
ncbi:MAG: 8-amino-7-oxononanoate synthase [Hyphomicrobium sp.]